MPVDPPDFKFTAEGGEDDGLTFMLTGPDLPHLDDTDHVFGGKVDETATHYPGGDTSVQRHGWKFEPVNLQGALEDAKVGVDGHARRMRNVIERFARNDGVIHLQYGEDGRWGTMDARFTEIHRGKIEYEITFRPYWDEPPELQGGVSQGRPPNDAAVAAEQYVNGLDLAGDPPEEVGENLKKQVLLAVARLGNAWSDVMQRIQNVAGWADLARDAAELVVRAARSAMSAVESVLRTVESLTPSQATGGESGLSELVAVDWASRTARRARLTKAAIFEFIRELRRGRQPRTTRTHVVGQGESLQSIAQDKLGDFSRWIDIADLNDLDTNTLETGQELTLPPR